MYDTFSVMVVHPKSGEIRAERYGKTVKQAIAHALKNEKVMGIGECQFWLSPCYGSDDVTTVATRQELRAWLRSNVDPNAVTA